MCLNYIPNTPKIKFKIVRFIEVHIDAISHAEFVNKLASKLSVPSERANLYLNTFVNVISETLAKGGDVNIIGFGKFITIQCKARVVVGPRDFTKKIFIPATVAPKFRAGDVFKEMLNNSSKHALISP